MEWSEAQPNDIYIDYRSAEEKIILGKKLQADLSDISFGPLINMTNELNEPIFSLDNFDLIDLGTIPFGSLASPTFKSTLVMICLDFGDGLFTDVVINYRKIIENGHFAEIDILRKVWKYLILLTCAHDKVDELSDDTLCFEETFYEMSKCNKISVEGLKLILRNYMSYIK